MDLSVVAAVGSFFMSERVLKPKATVLVILGCVLCYDLTTKTHDNASLRAYRGPALIAFTLMMTALSLRTWRRNGVACDELLFLPGTPHGDTHGVFESIAPLSSSSASPVAINSASNTTSNPTVTSNNDVLRGSEGDVAAGWQATTTEPTFEPTNLDVSSPVVELVGIGSIDSTSPSSDLLLNGTTDADFINSDPTTGIAFDLAPPPASEQPVRQRSSSRDSSLSSIQEFMNSWDEADHLNTNPGGEEDADLVVPLTAGNAAASTNKATSKALQARSSTSTATETVREGGVTIVPIGPSNNSNEAITTSTQGPVERFRENHPRITRIGSFFFFRSSATSTQNAAYAPSGPSVVGAALDMSMPILFNFHLFIEAYNHLEPNDSDITAKILPLIFLTVLGVRTVVPPGRRGRFWNTMKFTLMAPLPHSRFRDSFIGDILTSLVRPLQDIVFACAYYFTVIWGTITGKHGLSESGEILGSSMFLHNFMIPATAIIPLWLKYLQTLRVAYDANKRWPHLGNSFKFLSASVVIIYGMAHPEGRASFGWISCFVLTLLYQIYWDTVVDWELFVITPRLQSSLPSDETVEQPQQHSVVSTTSSFGQISSVHPESRFVFWLYRNLFQPAHDLIRWIITRTPHYRQIQLRPKRLYKTETFYWRIFAYNTIFRFCWMLSFIPFSTLPAAHKEEGTIDTGEITSTDTKSYIGVLLPVAEILRRAFWGFLLLEVKTIHMTSNDNNSVNDGISLQVYGSKADSDRSDDDDVGDDLDSENAPLSTYSHDSKTPRLTTYLPTWLGAQHQIQHETTMASLPVVGSSASQTSGGAGGVLTWSRSGNLLHPILNAWKRLTDFYKRVQWDEELQRKLFAAELALWVVAFVVLGYWATI